MQQLGEAYIIYIFVRYKFEIVQKALILCFDLQDVQNIQWINIHGGNCTHVNPFPYKHD